jgi:hypothetical protein
MHRIHPTAIAVKEPNVTLVHNAIVPKPISRKRRDEIRVEVFAKAERKEEPYLEDRVLKRLKCEHEELVSPSLNPQHAVCSQCRQKSLLSRA